MSLKNKLTIIVVLIIFILNSFSSYLLFLYSKKIFIENQKTSLSLVVSKRADEIRQIFYQSSLLVGTICSYPDIVNYLKNDPQAQNQDILSRLNSYNIGNQYSAIYIMDPQGLTLVSTDESFVGNNYSFREYFVQAINNNSGFGLAVGITSKKLGYYFSCPVKTENNEILGVVVAKMKPDVIDESVELNNYINYNDQNIIADDSGVIIYSNNKEIIYSSLGTLSYDDKDEIINKKRFPDIKIEPLIYNNVQKLINKKTESAVLEEYNEINNINEIISFVKIEDFPIYVIVKRDAEKFTAQAVEVSFVLSIFNFLSAFIIAIIIYLIFNQSFKPLKRLNDFVKDIGSNKINQKIIIKTGDEIGDLARSFNDMAYKLKNSRTDIEKIVEKRTLELEKLNNTMTGRELKMIELKKEIKELKDKLKNK